MPFETGLLLPALMQMLSVMALAYAMGGARFVGARSGRVDMREVVKSGRWPDKLGVLSDSYNNQFQVPQLFYAVCIILTLVGEVTPVTVGLAWAFVGLRIAHMLWHNTKNIILIRFALFVASGTVLTILVVIALLNILAVS